MPVTPGFFFIQAALTVLALAPVTCNAADKKAQPKKEAAKSEPAQTKDDKVSLPGIVVDPEKYCVDVDATICLRDGTLELIACTKNTKEHESIIVVDAKPSHIHAGLLLLGARPGHPAMRKPLPEDDPRRWIDLPPEGDLVALFLVFANKEGVAVEYPISDFITASGEGPNSGEKKDAVFPNKFVFAGSMIQDDEKGNRIYLPEQSGDVISISTFGDEMLCLPGINGQDNDSLAWSINPEKLPEKGAKIILRLRPVKPKAPAKP